MKGTHLTGTACFCALCCLSVLSTAPAIALPVGSDSIIHSVSGRELIQRGQYEKGLEQLSQAYALFPLNVTLKQNLAEGYAAYGHQFFKQKKYEQAGENFVKALELYPDNTTYTLLHGICCYNLKRYDVARYELQRARELSPDSVEVLYFLGLVQYDTDNRAEAVELWEQALKLAPERKEISALLAKARKEIAVEAGMDRGHSSRFNLTYDPDVDSTFALALLDVLESAANLVGAELGLFPAARVPVAIYTRADYKTVTDSPDWSGGFYDGTIRLPFGAVKEVTPALRGVLYHEYAHVIVFELTRGNCPLWLNEGIAEMFGRMQYNQPLMALKRAARSGKYADFRKLEGGFGAFSSSEAGLAYQQSYSLVNYMVTSYGWHRVKQILGDLGQGMTFDAAVSLALKDYNLNYNRLVLEWSVSLAREAEKAEGNH
ncbi:MAG TPA: tetratricopeptide repeat protein [Desulfuromonadales bacterium]|nr:tetratricopeptide repeat protein [Desulfuromonadales bacterium]